MAALSDALNFRHPARIRGRNTNVRRNIRGETRSAIRASCQSRKIMTRIIAPRVRMEVVKGIRLSIPNDRNIGASFRVRYAESAAPIVS
jgi:hypothetical protein